MENKVYNTLKNLNLPTKRFVKYSPEDVVTKNCSLSILTTSKNNLTNNSESCKMNALIYLEEVLICEKIKFNFYSYFSRKLTQTGFYGKRNH